MSRRKSMPPPKITNAGWFPTRTFITLLFAFFVVMFASSQADKGKAKQVSEAVREALEGGKFGVSWRGLLGRTLNAKPEARPSQTRTVGAAGATGSADLSGSLASLNQRIARGDPSRQVKLEMQARGLVISLREAAFFPPATTRSCPAPTPAWRKSPRRMRKLPNAVRPGRSHRFGPDPQLSLSEQLGALGRRGQSPCWSCSSPVSRSRRIDCALLGTPIPCRWNPTIPRKDARITAGSTS